jgi:hypothetical protein
LRGHPPPAARLGSSPEREFDGFLGQTRESVEKSGFFSWFHLEKASEPETRSDRITVSYRPSGDKFHDVVVVEVTTRSDQAVAAMALRLDRAFIDGPDGIFARDIAKSFLRDALDTEDADELADLINQIEFGGVSARPVLTARTPPPMPSRPVLGYDTFLGGPKPFVRAVSSGIVSLANEEASAGKWLRVAVSENPTGVSANVP